MIFRIRVPAPPLNDLVEMLWFSEGYTAAHEQERLLPTGTMELVVPMRGEEPLIAGAHSHYFVIDTPCEPVLGAHFRPGGAFAILGMPATELRNVQVSLEDLWGAAVAGELRERLQSAQTNDARFDLLEQALVSRIAARRHPAIGFAVREIARRLPRVETLVEKLGLSHRRFIQTFADEVGLTPKVYTRVQRFQRVLRCVADREEVDWADVALACGYFDQPHLIHEFRAISGLTPTEYLARRTPHMNHVPL
jgi:AraC-like DNA-binding protein